MNAELIAYLAGIIDGDGHISIRKTPSRERRGGKVVREYQPTYSERVSAGQVIPFAVDLLHRTFPGDRGYIDKSKTRSRDMHCWEITDLKASEFLRIVAPYLTIKRDLARSCLILRWLKAKSKDAMHIGGGGRQGSLPRPTIISEAMEYLFLRCRATTKSGRIRPLPPPEPIGQVADLLRSAPAMPDAADYSARPLWSEGVSPSRRITALPIPACVTDTVTRLAEGRGMTIRQFREATGLGRAGAWLRIKTAIQAGLVHGDGRYGGRYYALDAEEQPQAAEVD